MPVRILIAAMLCLLFSCKSKDGDHLFVKLSAGESGIDFNNKLTYNDSLTVLEFVYMFNGAGVALIDINNDGLQDIFFTGNMVPAKLYLNKGNLEFEDITQKAGINTSGWMNGAAVVDINQDGFQDLYVCKTGNYKTRPGDMRNMFFMNNGNGTFTESAAKMNLAEEGYDVQAAFLDYDKDGDLDMYLMRNAIAKKNRSNTRPEDGVDKEASIDKLFRNNGDLTFTDVSKEAGINIEGFGLGVTVCDINNDNWPDVYVSNDFLTGDLMWVNNGNGTFTNRAKQQLRHETYNGMGNDVADYNNDGLQDIMVVDMLPPDNKRWKLTMMGNAYDEFQQNFFGYNYDVQYVRNTLQLNNGDGTFSDIGMLAGVHATEWSWAPLFADFDNDGWKDLFVSNGFREDINNLDFVNYGYNIYGKKINAKKSANENRLDRLEKLRSLPGIQVKNHLYKNDRNLKFDDVSEEWGMSEDNYSNGTAYGDLDKDGDLDLVINMLDGPSAVYENKSSQKDPSKSWLRIKFEGPNGNKDGLESKVWLWQKGAMQYNYFTPYRGYLSSVEQFLHFGIDNGDVDSVKIIWPNGKEQLLRNIKPKQVLTLSYKNSVSPVKQDSIKYNQALFTPANDVHIKFNHTEDYFVDFKLQPLLPHMHGRGGPGLGVADVNSDGLEDFFVGTAAGVNPVMFVQQKNGQFTSKEIAGHNTSDNMGALFFDADNDGDNDLYVASGGALPARNDNPVYQHHLYINDGKGNFKVSDALPNVITSASGVKAADYDKDGDLDLFVCGRVSPGEYPTVPRSFLLRNDSKDSKVAFADVTADNNLSEPGMISDALWTDFDNDGWMDLILVGEFMPVNFFKNTNGKFSDVTAGTGLAATSGWWNGIVGADFDNDGDIDYVAGNLGLNGPYKATEKEPVCVYASDYDNNGKLDPILCNYRNGEEYIVHSRDDINRQMTAMKSRFRSYDAFASATFKQAMREDEIAKALVLKAERFESSYIENLGGGKFKLHSLPLEAQFSPIFGMIAADVNDDGNIDVVAVGNSFATEVQTGRYDAQGSLVLMGDGKGGFKVDRTIFNVGGDNKSIAYIQTARGYSLLVGTNSDSLKVFNADKNKKIINLLPQDAYAVITNADGKKSKHEFYYGHSYLSQGSRSFAVPKGTKQIDIFSFDGKKRMAELPKTKM